MIFHDEYLENHQILLLQRVFSPKFTRKCKFDQIKGAAAEGKVNIFQKIYCLCAIGPKRITVDMFAKNGLCIFKPEWQKNADYTF